ncbi:MAG: response regulator [Candidatus Omnitrophica bacterium]|nr:response regulator [Candidatus Omnitrophota bacterium]
MDNRKRILICDDEEGIRESLKLILEDSFELDFASSGNEAVRKIQDGKFDGMILDIKMPAKDGLETLEEVRKVSPDTRVIIATGYQSVETASKAVKLGAIDYITKPFESEEVLKKAEKF